MKTIIHVNRANIAFNRKMGGPILPVYTVKQGNKTTYCHSWVIMGPCRGSDPRMDGDLSCGAMAWIETHNPVELIEPMPFSKVKILKEHALEGAKFDKKILQRSQRGVRTT